MTHRNAVATTTTTVTTTAAANTTTTTAATTKDASSRPAFLAASRPLWPLIYWFLCRGSVSQVVKPLSRSVFDRVKVSFILNMLVSV